MPTLKAAGGGASATYSPGDPIGGRASGPAAAFSFGLDGSGGEDAYTEGSGGGASATSGGGGAYRGDDDPEGSGGGASDIGGRT